MAQSLKSSANDQTFKVGERCLPIVKSRRKKSIGLKANAQQIELHVPQHLSAKDVQRVLNQHADWIAKRLQTYHPSQESRFLFQWGDEVWFFGNRLVFQPVFSATATVPHIKVTGDQFDVVIPKNHPNAPLSRVLTPVLKQWFTQQALAYFEHKLPLFAKQIGVTYSAIEVKGYRSRWGSCYSDGRIQFNWKLLQAPEWVVDYVMVHELCHLKHANHSPAFWQLVEGHYSQMAHAKQWLKTHQHRLIGFLN